MMEITLWDYSNIISKWLMYIGIAAAIGGPFIAALINTPVNKKSLLNYIVISSVLGFAAVIINFFIQVGAFSETGLSGMFDAGLISFLWQSAVGDSVLWRLLAFTVLGFALLWDNLNAKYGTFSFKDATFTFLYVAAIVSFAYSFTFIGHSAVIGGAAKWLLAFHIITVSWWVGALYPLWLSCKLLQPPALYKLMCLFGKIAMFMVGILIACGIGLLYLFLENPLALLTTTYGLAMLLKLIFVGSILLIAAYHKFRLVEEIQQQAGIKKLQKSIKNEMLIAVVILTITAVLSSILGPE
ncbi:copper resistance protein CopD [Psychromonas sp. MB-3u-54]|uniref:copper resistance D family protein n=1 Tax=Psychromonas sp. MB-3u-54 TaxID=2058319 RepID=UPI000C339D66|nr:CopD family protein [Psychromonas sp. MB-3u-54]PKH02112.1 copper resistance protein CopD [Psychromonas sp. MB-3u-54]